MDSGGQRSQQGGDLLTFLPLLDRSKPHKFSIPIKRINERQEVSTFLTSCAYADICKFIMQLNISMCPKVDDSGQVQTWELGKLDAAFSEPVQNLQNLLKRIDGITDEVPPDAGPRRFGNVSFRKWYELLESRVADLLKEYLPADMVFDESNGEVAAIKELTAYLLGGFGSSQRLDYGTGHELSFLAFLGCVWKLGGFQIENANQSVRDIGRSIVLGLIEPYLRVIRRLIITYTLEPAGSHGVWGLDDHSFLPYIFGSAQYCPAIKEYDIMPTEGSLPNAPEPGDIAKKSVVDQERETNMYFAAIGFINDVKTGPFWEHSPTLFDISGVRSGWGKINKGMIKMYNAEVLSKFPVVQHFPFGYLFSWDQDSTTLAPLSSIHPSVQPSTPSKMVKESSTGSLKTQQLHQKNTRAPWAR